MTVYTKGLKTYAEHRRRQQHIPWGDPLAGYLAFDDFTRADNGSSLGSAEKGGAWTSLAGTWGISSNTAQSSSTTQPSLATIAPGTADYDVSLTVVSDDYVNHEFGLLVKAVDASNYVVARCTSTTAISFRKVVAGSSTTLVSYTIAITNGTPLTARVTCRGNVFTMFLNGTQVTGAALTLAGADATQFGSGVVAPCGLYASSFGVANSNVKFSAFSVSP